MKIVLVGSDHEENLSVRYLAAPLRAAGHLVEFAPFRARGDLPAVVATCGGAQVVGLSMVAQARARDFLALAAALKALEAPPRIVAGGHFASCAAEELLDHCRELDVLVLHEGEHTLRELVDVWDNGGAVEDVPGLIVRGPKGLVRTAARRIVEDLDTLPFPDRSGPVTLYAGVPTATLLGSRGCVAHCDYCCIMTLHHLVEGRRFRQRAPTAVAAEMAHLYHARGIRQFIFHDDNFLVPSIQHNLKRLDALDAAWRQHGLEGLGLVIKCRPPDVQHAVFARLREMGLVRVFLGIESGSSQGLRSIGRKQSVESSEAALEVCWSLGISAQYNMMCFHPDATLETLRADVAFMQRNHRFALNFCRTEIYRGTPLEERMLREGRARGTFMARTYAINDPVVELVSSVATQLFLPRCWDVDGLIPRATGLEHLAAVVDRFYDGQRPRALAQDLRNWLWELNLETVAQLSALVDEAESARGVRTAPFERALRALVQLEARSRKRSANQGEKLRRALEQFVRAQVGMAPDGVLLPVATRRAGVLARHAAAVLVAFAAAGTPSCNCGVSETAAEPLRDSDGDGLPDGCEVQTYGTDPNRADSDGDGVLDGSEDANGDGITNATEQANVGNAECPVQAQGDGGVRDGGGGDAG